MTQSFNLILTGNTLPGRDRKAAVLALSKVLRLPEADVHELLKGREQVVERDLDELLLARYVAALQAAGVEMRAEPGAESAPITDHGGRDTRIRELEALTHEINALYPYEQVKVTCPCCRRSELRHRGSEKKPCSECGWEDDLQQIKDQDKVVPGKNRGLSLKQARDDYQAYGSLDPKVYKPNAVPLRLRVINGLVALFVVVYCAYSLWTDRMFLWVYNSNVRRAYTGALQGVEIWLMSAALLAGVFMGILLIVDHYDRRRNEHRYERAGRVCYVLMTGFLGLALTLEAFRTHGLGLAIIIGVFMSIFVTLAFVHRKAIRLATHSFGSRNR